MGRHETFENATLIADELLAGTMLGRAPTGALPEPGSGDAELLALSMDWEVAAAAYDQALRDQSTITDRADTVEAPPPREPYAEWARLVPGWREQTGVETAEAASSDALDDLCEIEDRISNMPATTLAGLKLKARVAQRNEVSWPEGLEESLVRDILAIGETAVEADAELLRLGRQFEAASARENEALEACNAAQQEADRRRPERPPSLLYRASDECLHVHQYQMMPEALEGREIRSSDIEWLRRKMPMHHEVLRPIRAGERAHIDHPGRKFDIVPHAEAQARAEEITAAWDAWRAEIGRIQDQYVTPELDGAAEAAGEAAAGFAGQIALLPARTAAGFRVKLRALSHYRPKALPAELQDELDPAQILSHSLWRDTQAGAAPAEEPVDWHNPPPGFMAYPANNPQQFVIVSEGLRMEMERLHRIALAEYARKVGPDATEATRARVRSELRLGAFEIASPNDDAEILALGLDLDAVHARWRAATPAFWAAQKHVRQACERAKACGGSISAASEAAWKAPGVTEADALFEDIGDELERISKAIWRTPARTPLGLAVKARATLVMVFVSGQYERDSHLGEDEDLTEQAARALIEACCALAGVDWKGQPVGDNTAPETPALPRLTPDRAWAVAQAAAIDLSGLTVLQLSTLFRCFADAADRWLDHVGTPWADEDPDSPYSQPNAGGRVVGREQDRAAEIRDRIVEEMRCRTPTSGDEYDWRLETLIQHEIMCNGSLRHAPELRAEIAKTWGG